MRDQHATEQLQTELRCRLIVGEDEAYRPSVDAALLVDDVFGDAERDLLRFAEKGPEPGQRDDHVDFVGVSCERRLRHDRERDQRCG